MSNRLPLLRAAVVSALACGFVRADLVTGRVVDSTGAGVAGVDLDFKNLGAGGDPTPQNDGTDANGFFATSVPAGLYRVTFLPPAPPIASHLPAEVDDLIVVGTVNLGTIALPPGVALSGRAVDAQSSGIAEVNIDVIEVASGDNLDLTGDTTDSSGFFAVVVPEGAVELRLDATGVSGQTLASRSLDVLASTDMDVGDVLLPAGFRITGGVVGPTGLPVANADFDVLDPLTGEKLYTPQDDTGPGGAFSIVVPAGRWKLELCPQLAQKLVAQGLRAFDVLADVDLGALQLEGGAYLSGTITGAGAPVPGADVDAERADGTPITLCSDDANAQGSYTVVLPTGVVTIQFEPPGFALPLGADEHLSVPIGGNTILHGVLPACPSGANFGAGTPGSGGFTPHLATSGGAPRVGNPDFAIEVTNGLAGAHAILLVGTGPWVGRSFLNPPLPFPGLALWPAGTAPMTDVVHGLYHPLVLAGIPGTAGAGTTSIPTSIDGALVGTTAYVRLLSLDPGATLGFSLSDGLQIAFCD